MQFLRRCDVISPYPASEKIDEGVRATVQANLAKEVANSSFDNPTQNYLNSSSYLIGTFCSCRKRVTGNLQCSIYDLPSTITYYLPFKIYHRPSTIYHLHSTIYHMDRSGVEGRESKVITSIHSVCKTCKWGKNRARLSE